MHIAFVSLAVALTLICAALALAPTTALAWALLWPAAGALTVAIAYFSNRPQLFGKRSDGSVAWWARALGLPVYAATLGVWHLVQLLIQEHTSDEVAPGILVGRWPRAHEIAAEVQTIVDLTAEHPARAGVRERPGYRAYPILDAMSPDPKTIEAIVRPLVDTPGPVLIHCAVGHGRSAIIAAALALARGDFEDPDQAIARMQQARPRIRLHTNQRKQLWRWFEARA